MYSYFLLINKDIQNQTKIQQELIDIEGIQVIDLNSINIINQATLHNDLTNDETQLINNHFTHKVCFVTI